MSAPPESPDRRVFLDPARPALAEAARWLTERFAADQRNVLVVVPVGRAGRRLLELLIESADALDAALVPPDIVTTGRFIDRLASLPEPDRIASQLAWIAALRETNPADLTPLMPDPPESTNTVAWAALAEQLDALHADLAGESLAFADVPERAAELPDFNDEPRWRLLDDLHARYEQHLASLDRTDPHAARRTAIDAGQLDNTRDVVVIAATDLNRTQRDALDTLGDRVTYLVHASPDTATAFDAHGCVDPAHWCDEPIAIPGDRWRVVDAYADQAYAAVEAIAKLDGAYTAEQITVGVCDEQTVAPLEQVMPAHGLPVRYAAGTPASRTRPLRLLLAAADWLDRRRFADLAALMRHPDIEAVVAAAIGETPDADDWLTTLDRYFNDTLAARGTGPWLGDDDRKKKMKAVHDAITGLMDELAGDPRPLGAWAPPIANLVIKIFGPLDLDERRPADRLVVRACDAIREQLLALPAGDRAPQTTAGEAMRLVVRFIERSDAAAIPPEADAAAIELLGPLELHLDDAPALVVTGFNEGKLPSSLSADPFLPNNLRRHLGLVDNDRRYARDAYALSAILASRPHVTLITGRRTGAGDPLTPSRLAFATDPDTAARRVKRFADTGAAASAVSLPPGLSPTQTSAFVLPREPDVTDLPPIAKLSVTDFARYINCPYRFYLSRVLKLRRIDDAAQELDGLSFGNLAHAVLDAFGKSDDATQTHAPRIVGVLNDLLDDRVKRKLGNRPLPAVRIQIAMMRERLAAFARFQAAWATDGWRIAHTEKTFEKDSAASFTVDGEPLALTGRIDRVDIHESTGEVAVFDYKTSDSGDGPDKTHRKRKQWVDLQLPLYRHLVRSMGIESPVRLGYIVLPRDTSKANPAIGDWSDDDLRAADEKAAEVVRDIRAKKFWPPAPGSPAFDDFADICGVDQLATAEHAGEGGGDDD